MKCVNLRIALYTTEKPTNKLPKIFTIANIAF